MEVLVVIAIIAILAAIAGPNYGTFQADNRQIAVVNDFVANLQRARSEATMRSENICICKSADGATCGGGGTNWENGWIVFTDTNRNGVVDPGETLLQSHPAVPAGMTVRGNNNIANRITFNTRGYALGSNGTMRFCDQRGSGHMRTLVIASSGRLQRGGAVGVCP